MIISETGNRKSRFSRHALLLAAATTTAMGVLSSVSAVSVTWTNGAGNMQWDTSSTNWNGAVWTNANKDEALFDVFGVGDVIVSGNVVANSLNFALPGYSLSGSGSISMAAGAVSTLTLGAGCINAAYGASAQINTPINSSIGLVTQGAGTLILNAPYTSTGSYNLSSFTPVDIHVGKLTGGLPAGMLQLPNTSYLAASTRMGIGMGYVDIGTQDLNLTSLTFTGCTSSQPWNDALNANNGIIGSGTVHVSGAINVLGSQYGNSLAANLDLGGGMKRIGVPFSMGIDGFSLMITGSISNGSLYKTSGFGLAGDGLGLFGDNTYTGPTILAAQGDGAGTARLGSTIMSGTNATSSIKANGGGVTLVGEKGSILSATTIEMGSQAYLWADNNRRVGYNISSGARINDYVSVLAANNNDRIRDDAAITLHDGGLGLNGFGGGGATSTETFGSLNITGGHNNVWVFPHNDGTAILTCAGNLTLAQRATLIVKSPTWTYPAETGIATNTLGANAQFKVNGTISVTPDATGILPRIVSDKDFLTYNAVTGFTPYTGYATDFTTPGANVSVTTDTSASTVAINALKGTGTVTVTIGATDTVTLASGMILSTNENKFTVQGGTIAVGSKPAIFFQDAYGSQTRVSSAITGTDGIISAPNGGSVTIAGNLSGLSGTLSHIGTATTILSSNTFTGPIEVRQGTFLFGTSQTGPGLGAITLGNPNNETDMMSAVPTLNLSIAGPNTNFDRDIVVSNVTKTVDGVPIGSANYSYFATLVPISNYFSSGYGFGTQTINGNITLNTSLNVQGGGGGSGATVFTGTISGTETFISPNGHLVFTSSSVLANAGGIYLGNSGMSSQVELLGSVVGTAPITFNGGNSQSLRYASGSLPTGTFTIQNAVASTLLTISPAGSSTINNWVNLNGESAINVFTGVTATWAGTIAGGSPMTKSGNGTLVFSGNNSAHTGDVTLGAGTLELKNNGATSAWQPALTTPGIVNVRAGRLVLSYSGSATTPASTVLGLLTSSYNNPSGGLTNIANKIRCSTATTTKGLGWIDTGSAVQIGYTYYGDATLDGKVNTLDFNMLAGGFGGSGNWGHGDFNYDGVVNSVDFNKLAGNYGLSLALPSPELGSVVPEPTSAAVLLMGGTFALRRRRR
jgi:autotransporter-associated beta strand protein